MCDLVAPPRGGGDEAKAWRAVELGRVAGGDAGLARQRQRGCGGVMATFKQGAQQRCGQSPRTVATGSARLSIRACPDL